MLALKIILLVIGLAFTLFGYLICFKKKYSLINGFSEELKRGEKNETYAKKVGIIEFIIGITIIISAAIFIVFA